MFDKLNAVESRYDELMTLVSDAAVQADPNEYRKHAKELADIQPLVEKSREYRGVVDEAAQAQELAQGAGEDPELRELVARQLGKKLSKSFGFYISDAKYYCPPLKDAREIIKKSRLDKKTWVEEKFDCDDFAHRPLPGWPGGMSPASEKGA